MRLGLVAMLCHVYQLRRETRCHAVYELRRETMRLGWVAMYMSCHAVATWVAMLCGLPCCVTCTS